MKIKMEVNDMKIAVSVMSDDLNSMVNPVFGRCAGFLMVEVDGKEIKNSSYIENESMSARGGAGIAAAQSVINQGAKAVISGNLGPNAFMVLKQMDIKVYQASGLSVKVAIEKLADGKLPEMTTSSVETNFGMGSGRGMGVGRGTGRGMGRGRGLPIKGGD